MNEMLCVCGHTAHWHAVDGVCEHDGDCLCRRLCPGGEDQMEAIVEDYCNLERLRRRGYFEVKCG